MKQFTLHAPASFNHDNNALSPQP